MLRFDGSQMAQFEALARADLRQSVRARLVVQHPDLQPDQAHLDPFLDQLMEAGFLTFELLMGAAHEVLSIAQRTDPAAADARAVAETIILVQQHDPAARLAFLRAQMLRDPPQPAEHPGQGT